MPDVRLSVAGSFLVVYKASEVLYIPGGEKLLPPEIRNGRSRSSGRSSVDPLELRVNGAGAEVNIY